MSLRDLHEEFLALTIESRDHHGQDITFDLSSPSLSWWNDETGVVPASDFILGGWANIVGENGQVPGSAADATVQRSSVTVRLSSMSAKCAGVPAAGALISVTTRTGLREYVVESGMTRVDDDLGRVQYYLTNVEDI